MLTRELSVEGNREPEQKLRVQARDERDGERAQLITTLWLDLHRALGEAVQAHQVDQRARAVGGAFVSPRDRGHVDRVVEMGVPDENPDDASGRSQEALVKRRVGVCRRAADDACERHAREVGVDVDRLPLVAEAVPRHAEPFELQPPGQLQRLARELAHRVGIVVLSLTASGGKAREARKVVENIGHRRDLSQRQTEASRVWMAS